MKTSLSDPRCRKPARLTALAALLWNLRPHLTEAMPRVDYSLQTTECDWSTRTYFWDTGSSAGKFCLEYSPAPCQIFHRTARQSRTLLPKLLSLSSLRLRLRHCSLWGPSFCWLTSVLTLFFHLCILMCWHQGLDNAPPRASQCLEIINNLLMSMPFKCKPTNLEPIYPTISLLGSYISS